MTPDQLKRLSDSLPENATVLLCGIDTALWPSQDAVVAQFDVGQALSLPGDTRADIGIVLGATPAQQSVLARLRDVHCKRVILLTNGATDWSANQLRGLGFLEMNEADISYWLYDPALSNPPREWNSPTHWANPENFDRYRW